MSSRRPVGGLSGNTFSKLVAEREDTSPDIEAMAARLHAPEPTTSPAEKPVATPRKMFCMRITPELQESVKIIAIKRKTTPEKMVIEMLERFVIDAEK